jgi:hypothetical protein
MNGFFVLLASSCHTPPLDSPAHTRLSGFHSSDFMGKTKIEPMDIDVSGHGGKSSHLAVVLDNSHNLDDASRLEVAEEHE